MASVIKIGLVGCAVMVLGLATSAIAGSERNTTTFKLTQKSKGKSTGLTANIKISTTGAQAVDEILIVLPKGTKTKLGVPGKCSATSSEMFGAGAGACPNKTVVGNGSVETSALKGPIKIVNHTDGLYLIAKIELVPGTSINYPIPATFKGRKIEAKALGGYGVSDLKLKLNAVKNGSKVYIKTPKTCPPSKKWKTKVKFTYADDVKETASVKSACKR